MVQNRIRFFILLGVLFLVSARPALRGEDGFADIQAFQLREFIAALPLDRVGQVHLGGGHDEEGTRIDSHSAPTPSPVWELLRFLAARTRLNAVIVEWDTHLPPFDTILHEVAKAREILRGEPDEPAGCTEPAGAVVHG